MAKHVDVDECIRMLETWITGRKQLSTGKRTTDVVKLLNRWDEMASAALDRLIVLCNIEDSHNVESHAEKLKSG